MVKYSSLKTQANQRPNIPKLIKQKKIAAKRRKQRQKLFFISIGIIIIGSIILTKNLYIMISSKDLSFAVDYNFTNGYPEKEKLLRVQYMTLISREGDTAVVEVSGLTKESPHRNTTKTGVFKKNFFNSWTLKSVTN